MASFPFGLAYGVAVVAAGLNPWLGGSASWIVLAGAAQLSMVSLIEADAPWLIVVTTGLVINSRFALYSVALAPGFSAFPTGWRLTLPYLLTDQAAALAIHYFVTHPDPVERRWFYLSAAFVIATMWWVGTVVGVTAGAALPASIDVGFAVPLVFVVLLIPTLVDRPALVAALTAAVGTVAGSALPNGLNTLLGAGAGIALAAVVDGRSSR